MQDQKPAAKPSRPMRLHIYWAPEGRRIATVEAYSVSEALRKAPLPYRKYLGEMYTVLAD
jgi:hypothetical protein